MSQSMFEIRRVFDEQRPGIGKESSNVDHENDECT